jgi:hypothetical protein
LSYVEPFIGYYNYRFLKFQKIKKQGTSPNDMPEIPPPDYKVVVPDQVLDEVAQEQEAGTTKPTNRRIQTGLCN